MKNITIFNMHCGVHYYHAKIEIKIQLLYGEKKEKIYHEV